jgi:ABC-type Mn2+/Zn2+ transport system permease subunit
MFQLTPVLIVLIVFGFIFGIVGILLGNILAVTTNLQEEAAYFSMIFLFGGLGLVINYFIEKQSMKKE